LTAVSQPSRGWSHRGRWRWRSHGHSGADGKPECRGRELPNSNRKRTIRVCIWAQKEFF